jgi:hypothetical protein
LLVNFDETFSILNTFSDKGCTVTLYCDLTPHSLYFEITMKKKFILNGGFIFYGSHDGFGVVVHQLSLLILILIINRDGVFTESLK